MERRKSIPSRGDSPGRRPVPASGGERGSVLMEGVLVLPLYLMALGALFIIGDLARGRMVLQSMERSVTWLGGDRFAGHGPDEEGIGKMLLTFLEGTPYAKGDDTPDGLVNQAIVEGKWIGNRWLNGYMGYMLLPIDVPYWYGMANAEYVMSSRGSQPEGGKMPFQNAYMLPSGRDGTGGKFWRSYVVRRRPEDAGERYDRNADARTLVGGVWYNVFVEPWVVGGDDGFHELPEPVADSKVQPYKRLDVLIEMAE